MVNGQSPKVKRQSNIGERKKVTRLRLKPWKRTHCNKRPMYTGVVWGKTQSEVDQQTGEDRLAATKTVNETQSASHTWATKANWKNDLERRKTSENWRKHLAKRIVVECRHLARRKHDRLSTVGKSKRARLKSIGKPNHVWRKTIYNENRGWLKMIGKVKRGRLRTIVRTKRGRIQTAKGRNKNDCRRAQERKWANDKRRGKVENFLLQNSRSKVIEVNWKIPETKTGREFNPEETKPGTVVQVINYEIKPFIW